MRRELPDGSVEFTFEHNCFHLTEDQYERLKRDGRIARLACAVAVIAVLLNALYL